MAPLTAMVVEDEKVLRDDLIDRLARLWPELRVTAIAADGLQAMALLEEGAPDVLFLDIQLSGASGLEVARMADGRCHVVFVTAYDAYAVAAFDQGAADYLLKPYDEGRLAQAIRRVKSRLPGGPASIEALLSDLAAKPPPRDHLRWINASHGTETRLITVDEVCYFQADTKYVRVVTPQGEFLIRKSLKELAEQLDPAKFWLIHRSTIVNADAIVGVGRDMSGAMKVRLKNRPERLSVSEAHQRLFRQM